MMIRQIPNPKTYILIFLSFVFCVLPTYAKGTKFNYYDRIGIVYQSQNNEIYIATDSKRHTIGTKVKVITFAYDTKQSLLHFQIQGSPISNEQVNRVIILEHKLPFIYKLVAVGSDSIKPGQVGLGIIDSDAKFIEKDNSVKTDFDSDGNLENFRMCASSHGLHFTVWTGQPLEGTFRWHGYYILGYEADSNCTQKDYW